MRYVKQTLEADLDLSPETLPILDHYLTHIAKTHTPHTLDLTTLVSGAYFGEVVRQHYEDVRWFFDKDHPERARIEFARCFLHFNPFAMAREVLCQGDVPGWVALFQMQDADRERADRALTALGEMEAGDYYRLSTRFEALQTIVPAIMDLDQDQAFVSAEVYAAALKR